MPGKVFIIAPTSTRTDHLYFKNITSNFLRWVSKDCYQAFRYSIQSRVLRSDCYSLNHQVLVVIHRKIPYRFYFWLWSFLIYAQIVNPIGAPISEQDLIHIPDRVLAWL